MDVYQAGMLGYQFQHTAARRRLVARRPQVQERLTQRFNTQPPEGGWLRYQGALHKEDEVSTHSRPKAAGRPSIIHPPKRRSFNTQPPEGGWSGYHARFCPVLRFNTQPPEGGWFSRKAKIAEIYGFNTQPPEGGWQCDRRRQSHRQYRFNTQPPEGGWAAEVLDFALNLVSTHSRPKAAGRHAA